MQKLSEKEKDKMNQYQRKRYQYKKEVLQNKWFFFSSIRISKNTLKIDDIRIDKKKIDKSK